MTETPDPGPDLVTAMKDAGFTEYSRRAGVYVRMQWPPVAANLPSLVVPIDPTAREYETMRQAVLDTLTAVAAAGEKAQNALESFQRKATDRA